MSKQRIVSHEELAEMIGDPVNYFSKDMPDIESPVGTIFVGIVTVDGDEEYIFVNE